MRTQQFLKKFRRMVMMLFFGVLTTSVMAGISNDRSFSEKPGGGEAFETNQQEKIELESWMMITPMRLSNSAAEGTIELESWMLNRDSFKTTEELEMESLEEWMIRPQGFQTIEEKKLNVLEGWMTDKNFWNI
jgi:hypothetical protein